MGRVYKALLKADCLPDADRTIGRPSAEYASAQASQNFSYPGVSSEFAPRAFEESDSEWRIHPEAAPISSEEIGPVGSEPPAPSMAFEPEVHRRGEIRSVAPAPRQTERQQEVGLVFQEPNRCPGLSPARVAPHMAAINGTNVLATERYRTLS